MNKVLDENRRKAVVLRDRQGHDYFTSRAKEI